LPVWCIVTLAALLFGLGYVAVNIGDRPTERSAGVTAVDATGDDGAHVRPPLGLTTLPAAVALTVAWVVAAIATTCVRDRDAPSALIARLRGPPLVSFVPKP
jgi:hypothetical protein